MASTVTNRVYLPDGNKIYVSDGSAGDDRLEELFNTYGDLKMEACHKVWGNSLDELEAFWTGTIKEFFN